MVNTRSNRKLRPTQEAGAEKVLAVGEKSGPSKRVLDMQDKRTDKDLKKADTVTESKGEKNFYGYKCYLDKIIKDVKALGEKMDDITKEYLMLTPFAGFFQAILKDKIKVDMVDKCTDSIVSLIKSYTGEGSEFKLNPNYDPSELSPIHVSIIFGIKMGTNTFDTSGKVKGKPGRLEERYFKNATRISRKELIQAMNEMLDKRIISNENRWDVVKMLILYTFSIMFFATSSGGVNKVIVKKIDDTDYINNCCWPTMIHSYLMKSIQAHYQNKPLNVSGRVYLLLYFLLEHTSIVKPIQKDLCSPRMIRWSLSDLTDTNWPSNKQNLLSDETEVCKIGLTEYETRIINDVVKSELDDFYVIGRDKGTESDEDVETSEEAEQDIDNNENIQDEHVSMETQSETQSEGNGKTMPDDEDNGKGVVEDVGITNEINVTGGVGADNTEAAHIESENVSFGSDNLVQRELRSKRKNEITNDILSSGKRPRGDSPNSNVDIQVESDQEEDDGSFNINLDRLPNDIPFLKYCVTKVVSENKRILIKVEHLEERVEQLKEKDCNASQTEKYKAELEEMHSLYTKTYDVLCDEHHALEAGYLHHVNTSQKEQRKKDESIQSLTERIQLLEEQKWRMDDINDCLRKAIKEAAMTTNVLIKELVTARSMTFKPTVTDSGTQADLSVFVYDELQEEGHNENTSIDDILEEITNAKAGLKRSTLTHLISVAKQCKLDLIDMGKKVSDVEGNNSKLIERNEVLENKIKEHQSDMLHEKKTFINLFSQGEEVRNKLEDVLRDNKKKNDEISVLKNVIEALELKEIEGTKSKGKEIQTEGREADEGYQSLLVENQRIAKELEMLEWTRQKNDQLITKNMNLKDNAAELNKMVDELKTKESFLLAMVVKDAIPLESIVANVEKPIRRGRGRPRKEKNEGEANRIEGDKDDADQFPVQRKKPKLDVILNRKPYEEKGKMNDPRLSKYWDMFDAQVKDQLTTVYELCDRITQVWHSDDAVGPVMLTAVLLEDLYCGAWLSTDLVDWFFRWYLLDVWNKKHDMSDSKMKETCSLRSGCYVQWKSVETAENGLQMIMDDIDRKLNVSTVNLLVPIMPTVNHWALLFLEISSCQWFFYNSIAGREQDLSAADSFRRDLQTVLLPRIRGLRSDPTMVFKDELIISDGPLQQNGNDCGLYICNFAERLVTGGADSWHQEDIDNLRVEFVTSILMTSGHSWKAGAELNNHNEMRSIIPV